MIQLTYQKYPSVSDTFGCGVYYNCIPTSTPAVIVSDYYPITSKPKPYSPPSPITKYPWTIRTTENPIYVLDPYDHYHENVYNNNTADVQTIIRSEKRLHVLLFAGEVWKPFNRKWGSHLPLR